MLTLLEVGFSQWNHLSLSNNEVVGAKRSQFLYLNLCFLSEIRFSFVYHSFPEKISPSRYRKRCQDAITQIFPFVVEGKLRGKIFKPTLGWNLTFTTIEGFLNIYDDQ